MKLRVRETAERLGVNRSQLSRRSDLSLTTLNEIWDGTRVDVRLSTLKALAVALGVHVCDLIEDEDQAESPINIDALEREEEPVAA